MTRAVVFAYHDVGVRCLAVLLARGVEVPLLITHQDDADETIWFSSVAELARQHGVPTLAIAGPLAPELVERIRALEPDFMFSFYFRSMLTPALLQMPKQGAFNMHGSLLPKYRGRVPVNWAILCGERETGATLHEMVEKPDAGRIVDQQAVPILPNDLAIDVFRKVTVAAEIVLDRCLPALLTGTAQLTPQDLTQGAYFGGRRPEDGRIDWTRDAWTIHNLIRAVAPPYPGAFTTVGKGRLRLLRTFYTGGRVTSSGPPKLYPEGNALMLRCAGGGLLKVLDAELDGGKLTSGNFRATVDGGFLLLEN
jgi:methionyl-tRNA formyltransferase